MVNSARGLPPYYAGNDLGSHWLTFDLPFGQSTRNIWYSTMIPRKISSTGRVLIPFLGWLYIVIPWEPPSFSHDSKIIEPTSLDWFTGKFPGTTYIFMGKPWFPVDCTFNQSRDCTFLMVPDQQLQGLQKTLTDLAHEGIMHAGCAVHQAGGPK